jgi:hypothetical protein
MGEESSTSHRGPRSKVARLIDEHDLDGLGAEMEARWTAEDDRMSLRALAAHFNKQVLRAHLAAADMDTLDGELENIYRLLTADDVSAAQRTRVRRHLEREGLDFDALEKEFVTYQAVRSYLKDYRDAEYESDDRDPIARETGNLEQLRGRVETVTNGKLDQLRSNGELTLGSHRTVVDIKVVCEDCHAQYGVFELLDRGECDCR